jgi:hypothetical protein
MKRAWTYLTALIVALAALNLWWTARVAAENNHAWCGLIAVIAHPHDAPAPSNARQRIIVQALDARARTLGC